ncbi:MAG: hypothetical protein IT376_18270 [Polyangiaceae bacterium]|nr:hypothetical protein [Polyangiaceae bacterium]
MMLRLASLPLIALTAFAFVACGDDDDDGKNTGGVSTGGTAGGGSGGSSGGGGASGSTSDAPAGACISASDMAALDATYDGGKSSTDVAKTCAIGCLADPDPNQCALDCIGVQTNNAISTPCSSCILGAINCAKDSGCTGKCLNPDDPQLVQECNDCRCGGGVSTTQRNCIQEYEVCSGRDDTTC